MRYGLLIAGAAAASAAGIAAFLGRRKVWEFLKSEEGAALIQGLCVFAEESITGTKRGPARLEFVCRTVYEKLPISLQKYASPKMIARAVNRVFEIIAQARDGHRVAAAPAGQEAKAV